MFVKLKKNQIINPNHIGLAEFTEGTDDGKGGKTPAALLVVIDGQHSNYSGDEATAAWNLLSEGAE